MGRYFKESLQWKPSIFLTALTSTPQPTVQPKRVSEPAFEGHPHLSPPSREAAAEPSRSTQCSLSPILASFFINIIQLSCKISLEEINVTKLMDKIREVRGDYILRNFLGRLILPIQSYFLTAFYILTRPKN